MPLYELNLTLRPMPKKEVFAALKRAANIIWNGDGVVQKIEYLGYNKLPYSRADSQNEGVKYYEGSHFIYHVSMNFQKLKAARPELRLDMDIINSKFLQIDRYKIPSNYQCTLEEELKIPFERKSIQPLLSDKNVRADVRR